eukprot:1323578-Pyramimonas_sp.AAC.1
MPSETVRRRNEEASYVFSGRDVHCGGDGVLRQHAQWDARGLFCAGSGGGVGVGTVQTNGKCIPSRRRVAGRHIILRHC